MVVTLPLLYPVWVPDPGQAARPPGLISSRANAKPGPWAATLSIWLQMWPLGLQA